MSYFYIIMLLCTLSQLTDAFVPVSHSYQIEVHRRNMEQITVPATAREVQPLIFFSTTTRPASLPIKSKNDNDDGGGESGNESSKLTFLNTNKKDLPGLIFLSVLCLWHFWIGPFLRPIILEMRQ